MDKCNYLAGIELAEQAQVVANAACSIAIS